MMSEPPPSIDQAARVEELLVDQALIGLDPPEHLELEALTAAGHAEKGCTICMAAALLHLSMMTPRDFEPMPLSVRTTLEARGLAWAKVATSVNGRARRSSLHMVRAYGPWMAAAACLAVAAIAWLPRPTGDAGALAEHDPNHFTVQWASWDPHISGVTGHVCWSDCKDCGYLKIIGLPRNDTAHQYQLWIVDDRGMDQRISGGVFNSSGAEVRVPIRPGIPVHSPKLFAITLEPAGGTWVSDLSHKVAIAQRN